jgi:hypothetical protein
VKKTLFFLACGMTFNVTATRAAETPPILVLYQQRVDSAKVDVQKQVVQNDYDAQRLSALEDAYQDGAIPEATILDWRRQVALGKLTLQQLQSRVSVAEAELNVATTQYNAGQQVPLCSN